ncbi:MAG: class I SAM-dependent methyltransferase [Nanoarchaeota archaeon]
MRNSRTLLNELCSEKLLSNWVTPYTIFSSRRKINLAVQDLLSQSLSHLPQRQLSILDVGTYYGGMIFYFLNKYPHLTFHGIDVDSHKIHYAQDLLKEIKNPALRRNITFSTHNIEDRPLDSRYDVVLCVETIEHVHHVDRALAHIYKSLQPGGYFILSTPNKQNSLKRFIPFRKKVKTHIEEQDPVKEGYAVAENLFGVHIPNVDGDQHWSVMSLCELCSHLKQAGFAIEKVRRGPLLFGGTFFDQHSFLFALLNIFDEFLNFLPFWKTFSYDFIILAKKLK